MSASRRRLMIATGALAGSPLVARGLRAQTPPGGAVQDHPLGKADAPVTMIEYSSLTCPHCAEFQDHTFADLKARYIDTGKVKFVQRDFPLDQVALKAAVIAHCAGDRYPIFVDVMFRNQARWAGAADPVAALKQLGMAGGLAGDKVDACLADKAMEDAVLQSRLTAQSEFKVDSTPTFIINGKPYPGARSIDEFAKIIDPLLG